MFLGGRERVHWEQNGLKTLNFTIVKHIFFLHFFFQKDIIKNTKIHKKTVKNNNLMQKQPS